MTPEKAGEIVARLMPIGTNTDEGIALTLYVRAIERSAIEAEREACAQTAEWFTNVDKFTAADVAKRIRNRNRAALTAGKSDVTQG